MTFWTKISVFQKLQFIIPALFLVHKKIYISELSGQIFTNLPIMCEKKICANKMKLKWRNYLKQKICRTERKFIKLREEAKKPVSWHHDGEKTCLLASWWRKHLSPGIMMEKKPVSWHHDGENTCLLASWWRKNLSPGIMMGIHLKI